MLNMEPAEVVKPAEPVVEEQQKVVNTEEKLARLEELKREIKSTIAAVALTFDADSFPFDRTLLEPAEKFLSTYDVKDLVLAMKTLESEQEYTLNAVFKYLKEASKEYTPEEIEKANAELGNSAVEKVEPVVEEQPKVVNTEERLARLQELGKRIKNTLLPLSVALNLAGEELAGVDVKAIENFIVTYDVKDLILAIKSLESTEINYVELEDILKYLKEALKEYTPEEIEKANAELGNSNVEKVEPAEENQPEVQPTVSTPILTNEDVSTKTFILRGLALDESRNVLTSLYGSPLPMYGVIEDALGNLESEDRSVASSIIFDIANKQFEYGKLSELVKTDGALSDELVYQMLAYFNLNNDHNTMNEIYDALKLTEEDRRLVNEQIMLEGILHKLEWQEYIIGGKNNCAEIREALSIDDRDAVFAKAGSLTDEFEEFYKIRDNIKDKQLVKGMEPVTDAPKTEDAAEAKLASMLGMTAAEMTKPEENIPSFGINGEPAEEVPNFNLAGEEPEENVPSFELNKDQAEEVPSFNLVGEPVAESVPAETKNTQEDDLSTFLAAIEEARQEESKQKAEPEVAIPSYNFDEEKASDGYVATANESGLPFDFSAVSTPEEEAPSFGLVGEKKEEEAIPSFGIAGENVEEAPNYNLTAEPVVKPTEPVAEVKSNEEKAEEKLASMLAMTPAEMAKGEENIPSFELNKDQAEEVPNFNFAEESVPAPVEPVVEVKPNEQSAEEKLASMLGMATESMAKDVATIKSEDAAKEAEAKELAEIEAQAKIEVSSASNAHNVGLYLYKLFHDPEFRKTAFDDPKKVEPMVENAIALAVRYHPYTLKYLMHFIPEEQKAQAEDRLSYARVINSIETHIVSGHPLALDIKEALDRIRDKDYEDKAELRSIVNGMIDDAIDLEEQERHTYPVSAIELANFVEPNQVKQRKFVRKLDALEEDKIETSKGIFGKKSKVKTDNIRKMLDTPGFDGLDEAMQEALQLTSNPSLFYEFLSFMTQLSNNTKNEYKEQFTKNMMISNLEKISAKTMAKALKTGQAADAEKAIKELFSDKVKDRLDYRARDKFIDLAGFDDERKEELHKQIAEEIEKELDEANKDKKAALTKEQEEKIEDEIKLLNAKLEKIQKNTEKLLKARTDKTNAYNTEKNALLGKLSELDKESETSREKVQIDPIRYEKVLKDCSDATFTPTGKNIVKLYESISKIDDADVAKEMTIVAQELVEKYKDQLEETGELADIESKKKELEIQTVEVERKDNTEEKAKIQSEIDRIDSKYNQDMKVLDTIEDDTKKEAKTIKSKIEELSSKLGLSKQMAEILEDERKTETVEDFNKEDTNLGEKLSELIGDEEEAKEVDTEKDSLNKAVKVNKISKIGKKLYESLKSFDFVSKLKGVIKKMRDNKLAVFMVGTTLAVGGIGLAQGIAASEEPEVPDVKTESLSENEADQPAIDNESKVTPEEEQNEFYTYDGQTLSADNSEETIVRHR